MSDQLPLSDVRSARMLRIDEAAYHADPAPEPSLSASMATTLLDRSPLHAYHAHPRLGGAKGEATAAMDRGSLIHKLVLGAGADLAIIDADDWKTKAAREQRDAAREDGKIPVLRHAHDDAQEATESIRASLRALEIELDGESEATIVWREHVLRGDPIWCRGRLDHFWSSGRILDLKTTSAGAHPKACARRLIDYGYDVQRAAYVRAVEMLCPHLRGRVDFLFAFVEVEPPYAVTVGRLDGMLREHGERRWSMAVQRWASCLRRNEWPGYSSEIVTFESPGWLLSSMEEG